MARKKTRANVNIFYKELSIQEGYNLLAIPRDERNIDGMRVSSPSGAALYHHCRENNIPLVCHFCGVKASLWIIRHQQNDTNKPPVMDLFCYTSKNNLVMMTRDHIVPKSWGGLDDVQNLRCACEPCNRARKNVLDDKDRQFMVENPHLYNYKIPREFRDETASNYKNSAGSPPN